MPLPPIDPSMVTTGADWQIPGIGQGADAAGAAQGADGASFGDALTNAIESLQTTQTEAAGAARDLATGQAQDPAEVVLAIERARLSMDLAAQVRNKGVEAYQEIFRTQV
jgi:flagellar hook-basal body complex protein FliE